MTGYVYVMSNRAMPGLVKVGFTMNDPLKRAKQLSKTTSVPYRFIVEGYWAYPSYEKTREMERVAHSNLPDRINGSEFFKSSAANAFYCLEKFIGTAGYIFPNDTNDEYFALVDSDGAPSEELTYPVV